MQSDLEMYNTRLDRSCEVRTMTLNEELGQISHIFSDKTGTLTCNIMDFRKASINGVSYGVGITEIGKAAWKLQGKEIPQEVLEGELKAQANSIPHVSFYCPQHEKDMAKGGAQKTRILDFYHALAICHDVIPEINEGKLKLSASNPDDEALVCAAGYSGFRFFDRKDGKALVESTNEKGAKEVKEVEILYIIAFTSKRKRMSVICRERGKIILYCKGADTTMLERMSSGQSKILASTERHMRQHATEGLRCLLVGKAEIPSSKFEPWVVDYRKASTDLEQIERRKGGKRNLIDDLEDMIERDLTVMGVTAIEDRLQFGVPDCIAELATAGISMWMLTGDKEETAINIAIACNLVLPSQFMRHVIVNKSTAANHDTLAQLIIKETKVLFYE